MSSDHGGAGRTERRERWLKPIAKGKPFVLPSGKIVYAYKAEDLIFETQGAPVRKRHKDTGKYYYQDGKGTWRFFDSGKALDQQEIQIKPDSPHFKRSHKKPDVDPNQTQKYIPHEGTTQQFVFDYRNAMKSQTFNQKERWDKQQELNKGQSNVNKTLKRWQEKRDAQAPKPEPPDLSTRKARIEHTKEQQRLFKESIRQQRIDMIEQRHQDYKAKKEAQKLYEQRLDREATQGKPSAKRQYDRAVKQEMDKGGSRPQPHETSADVTRRLKRDLRRAEHEAERQTKQARIQDLEAQLKQKKQSAAQQFDKTARKQAKRDFQKMKSTLEQTGPNTYRTPDGETLYTIGKPKKARVFTIKGQKYYQHDTDKNLYYRVITTPDGKTKYEVTSR